VNPNAITASRRPGRQALVGALALAKPDQATRPEPAPAPLGEDISRAGGAQGKPARESPQHRGRARAKLALLTWAGAYAVLMLVFAIAGPAIAGWPLAVRALVLSGLMVAAMTWAIVPAMMRLFRPWLLR
jgi:hypothetical protein